MYDLGNGPGIPLKWDLLVVREIRSTTYKMLEHAEQSNRSKNKEEWMETNIVRVDQLDETPVFIPPLNA